MEYSHQSWRFAVVVGLAAILAGCQPKTDEKKVERKATECSAASENPKNKPAVEVKAMPDSDSVDPTRVERKVTEVQPAVPRDLPPPAVRQVALSDKLRETCLVNVGESLPHVELVNLDGKPESLEQLVDQKPTVVCFWSIGSSRAAQLRSSEVLKDLAKEVAEAFGRNGLQVVGVNVGDSAQDVRQQMAKAGATFPCLLDPKGEMYTKIASDQKPFRIFMLDPGGRILWFDVEFARQAKREFIQNIRAMLEQQK